MDYFSADDLDSVAYIEEDTNNVTNFYLISSRFPFPLSGILYSPAHVVEPFKEYEFEVISFVSSNIIEEDDNSVEDTDTLIDDTTDEIIPKDVDDNIIVDEIIEEEDIIVENILESENDSDTIQDNDSSVTNLIGLVLLLIVIVGGFAYYKKFKSNSLKSSDNSKSDSLIKIIHFDDNVTINIKKKEQ